MIKKRLAAALSLAIFVGANAHSAQYQVVELPLADKADSSFSAAIGADGEVLVNAQLPYNVPIDLSLVNFEDENYLDLLTDPDAARVGNFNINDYLLTRAILDEFGLQRAASAVSFSALPTQADFIPGYAEKNESGLFLLDTNTTISHINEASYLVGTGESPFYRLRYVLRKKTDDSTDDTDDDIEVSYLLNDFLSRGFVSFNNQLTELPPTQMNPLGGFSQALGINNNNQVIGTGTTFFESETVQAQLDKCVTDNDKLDEVDGLTQEEFNNLPDTERDEINSITDEPLEKCLYDLRDDVLQSSQTRGLIWQLDDSGNVIDTEELGMLITPEEDDTRVYSSSAVAINDNGIAVGQSQGIYILREANVVLNFATVYNGDNVINITTNVDESAVLRLLSGRSTQYSAATDINNNDLVIGYQVKLINGSIRNKLFVYDVNTGDLTFPVDLFNGSASVPLDINNNNQIVGYAEVEATQGVQRRTGGFIYDHDTGDFQNLNDLIDCDTPYNIVQANAINDQGIIAATALIQAPARDLRGEIILNEEGEEIIEDKVIAVTLEKISDATPQECEVDEDNENRPRQGASIYWLIGLAGIAVLRRRKIYRA